MRSYPHLLKQIIEKQQFSIYVLYGNEPFLIDESATLIKQHFQTQDQIEHIHFDLDSSHWSKLSCIEQPSLFALKQLIEIRLGKLTPSESSQFAEILQKCPLNTLLLIRAGQIRQKQPPAWFNYAQSQGLVVPHWSLSSSQFYQWIVTRCQQYDLKLSAQELHALIANSEGNCLAAAQEIERLRLYYASPSDNTHLLEFEQLSQFDVFDLCAAALLGQSTRVIKIVACLKENEAAPLQLIVWALAQSLRALIRAVEVSEDIQPRILQQAGIQSLAHAAYLQALKQPSPRRWRALLLALSPIDKQAKSGEIDAAFRGVLEICLSLGNAAFYANNA